MKWKKCAAAIMAVAFALCLTACGVQITGITLPESVELEVGVSEALTVEYAAGEDAAEDAVAEAAEKLALVWMSSDETVATVDTEGAVTAVAPGEAEITAASEDGKLTASCRVTVGVSVTGIAAPETLELQIGETETANLGAAVLPDNATNATLTYKSSNEAVATVGADGTVTAVGAGECEIEIKAAGFGTPAAKSTTKVVVSAPETQPADSQKSSGNNGSTATGGSNVSGGNGGNVTPPSNNGGSTGGNTTPPAPTQPDPTPAPAPDPTPAPQPDPPAEPDPAPENPPINDGTVIPGGGSDENNGGDAEIVE